MSGPPRHKSSTDAMIARVKDYDHLFKIIIIGDSGVGKTCILSRFSDGVYQPSFITTIGVDFKLKTVAVGDKRIKLQLWDTAGQERFRTIVGCYYRGAHGVMVVFDVQSRESFTNVKLWMYEIVKYSDKGDVQKILVGNKCEDPDAREVSEREAKAFAESIDVPYIETSALENINIDQVFVQLARMVLETRHGPKAGNIRKRKTSFKLTEHPKVKKKDKCC